MKAKKTNKGRNRAEREAVAAQVCPDGDACPDARCKARREAARAGWNLQDVPAVLGVCPNCGQFQHPDCPERVHPARARA